MMKMYVMELIQVLSQELCHRVDLGVALPINGKNPQTYQGHGRILQAQTRKIYPFQQLFLKRLIIDGELLTLQIRRILFSLTTRQKHSKHYLQLVFQELQRALFQSAQVLTLPLLALELSALLQGLPASFLWLQSTLTPLVADWTGVNLQALDLKGLAQKFLGEWQQSSDIMGYLFGQLTQSGLAIFGSLMTVALTPVVAFYLMRDWDQLLARLDQLIPRPQISVVRQLTAAGDEMLAAFIRGQFLVMILLGIFYAVGLGLVGLDMALIIGLVAGLASIVPYLGFILGLLLATIAAAYQFQDWIHPVYVLTVFVLGQILEGSLLTPWLVGDRIGLHPVAVIFAVLAGGQLFGFIGVLLALPVAAVLMVLVRYWLGRYLASGFYLGDVVAATCDQSEEEAALDTPLAATIESEAIDPDMPYPTTDESRF